MRSLILFFILILAACGPKLTSVERGEKIVKEWMQARAKLSERCDKLAKPLLNKVLEENDVTEAAFKNALAVRGRDVNEWEAKYMREFCKKPNVAALVYKNNFNNKSGTWPSLQEPDEYPKDFIWHYITAVLLGLAGFIFYVVYNTVRDWRRAGRS